MIRNMVVEPDDEAFLPVKVTHLLIGASPDAIIDHETVLEIKCPSVVRNQMINIKTVPFLKEEDMHLFLDNNHDYFYQIQGQLFCTGTTL